MPKPLTKTNYQLYRECPKDAWFKIHASEKYYESELSQFDLGIIETGNEAEVLARGLFPGAVLVETRDEGGQRITQTYLEKKQSVIFQAAFLKDGLFAAVDMLELGSDGYSIYEVKSKTKVDDKTYYHDLAFQVNLLRQCGVDVKKAYVIHLNSEYVRSGALDIKNLFKVVDVSEAVESLLPEVSEEVKAAMQYLAQEKEPEGYCSCIYHGRSRHCTTFHHSNPDVPEYGVHDIARIGNSKAKLKAMVDQKIFKFEDIPEHHLVSLSEIQQGQVRSYLQNEKTIHKEAIEAELGKLVFPLYFLDYETFPCGIPRFDGFSPFGQVPFQYSLHVLKDADSEPEHFEFLHTESTDPSASFAASLREHMGDTGSVLVWSQQFESGRNDGIGKRIPEVKEFMDSINSRVFDLETIFKKQHYIDRNFVGRTSIKKILPALVPELSYKGLAIQAGAAAAQKWNEIVSGSLTDEEKQKACEDLKTYCKLDTYAMYKIWKHLADIVKS